MFGGRPFYSRPSRFPLCLCDDRRGLILYDGGSLPNPGTEGGRLIHVLCSFCRALNGFCIVVLTSDKSSSTCWTGSIGLLLYISMFYMRFPCVSRLSCCIVAKRVYSLFTMFVCLGDCGISVRLVHLKPV